MRYAPVPPSLTLAVISRHYLIYLGFQSILTGVGTVVHLPPQLMSGALRTEQHPDLFVLDLETEQDAVDMIRQIRKSAATSKIILLSGVEDTQCLHNIFAHGVDGVILTVQPPTVMLAVIEALHDSTANCGRAGGNEPEGWDLGNLSKPKIISDIQLPVGYDTTTEREQEVIRLVCQGLSNKEIAYKLSISDSTVRHHLTNIFDKLGVANRQKLLLHTHRLPSVTVQPPFGMNRVRSVGQLP